MANPPHESPGCPIHQKPAVYGSSDLTYNDYLKVSELLDLQVPQSVPPHHDEMLFIIIHQAYELWFKLILHEAENAIRYMREKEVLRARHFVSRVVEVMKLLVQQIHILETMTPAEFLKFRDRLNPASGFQSVQFREVEFIAGVKDESYFAHFSNRPELVARLKRRVAEPDLRSAYYAMMRELGFPVPEVRLEVAPDAQEAARDQEREAVVRALLPVYQKPDENLPLYLLSESLVEFDEYLALWREHHVRVVERVIGAKTGTGGSSGVRYLRSTTSKKCFPYLWDVRSYLEKEV